MPTVQLTMHDKSSNLYGHTSKFFQLDGLLLFCIIMGLCSVSSTIMANGEILVSPSQGIECNGINMVVRCQSSQRLRVIQAWLQDYFCISKAYVMKENSQMPDLNMRSVIFVKSISRPLEFKILWRRRRTSWGGALATFITSVLWLLIKLERLW